MIDYPRHKLVLNRLANLFLRILFRIRLNDTTNAFKAYRKEVIAGCRPLISPHFNLTVELPLKAIVRGYTWTVFRSPGAIAARAKPSSRSRRWAVATCLCACTCGSKSTSAAATTGSEERKRRKPRIYGAGGVFHPRSLGSFRADQVCG